MIQGLGPYEKRQRGTQGNDMLVMEAEMGVMRLQASNTKDDWKHQKL